MIHSVLTRCRSIAVAGGVALLPAIAPAQEPDAEELFRALRLPEMIGIMREEGRAYAAEIGSDLFGSAPPADWLAAVDGIYDAERMEAHVLAALGEATQEVDLDPIITFFTTEPGVTLVGLEVAARRALLDDGVEQMAKEAAASALAEGGPVVERIERFVTANDLVETNVVAAMNSSFAFYLGLMDGGGFGAEMTETDLLRDVWDQEETIRASTEEWVYSFLLMAYDPAPAEDVEAYIAFSQTEAGRAANRAVFSAFDGVFEDISRALGLTAARFMATQRL